MTSAVDFSDDDGSFELLDEPVGTRKASLGVITISSDESQHNSSTEEYSSHDETILPKVNLRSKKTAVINKLFASSKSKRNDAIKKTFHKAAEIESDLRNIPSTSSTLYCPQSKTLSDTTPLPKQNVPVYEKMIGGVKILLPVEPYGSQTALIFKVITAINKSQNCLLESPTGSGKTLALLCGALAWQRQEKNRISQLQAQQYFSDFPELNNVKGATEYIASAENSTPRTPEKLFSRPTFGEKSIYNKPTQTEDPSISKRQQPSVDISEESSSNSLVNIHKKRRLYNEDSHGNSKNVKSPEKLTPEKCTEQQAETPQKVRNLYNLIDNLRLRTSMLVDCSVPVIYYGARTHKQLQQVVKEFKRTSYCGEAKMTILSSRDYSCIRQFDKQMWSTKNDMCRACIKNYSAKESENRGSNCKYYDNRQALSHKSLPPAFDLEELVNAGERISACPYYAARHMAQGAQIVFCPYNYLIEPTIRENMQIKLSNNIVIIDEAHNIEDICRDAASLTYTRDDVQAAIKEMEKASEYRFTDEEVTRHVDHLLRALKNWDDWFCNQMALVNNAPVNNNEAVYTWQVEHFVQTLNNHNIGQKQFEDFRRNANMFCQRLRDDPRTLLGVTQATATLVENIDTVLGYLFRSSGNFLDDFSPALIKTVTGKAEPLSNSKGWRKSQYNQWVEKESLSLKFVCLNPAVVFEGLRQARCIILASGTLTPMTSLHSELGAEFPLKVSPNHVISPDRVWIGTLSTCPDGQRLECTRNGLRSVSAAPALGQCVLAVCRVTPHGVLCFLPSYHIMNTLVTSWRETGIWEEVKGVKHVFMESRNVRDHNDIMEDYYKYVCSAKGALLLAVYRGKVSEGMDFKDHQARAVITIGIPYPNLVDMAVKEKMKYNDKYSKTRNLLPSSEWLRVQAYRALNQAVGRCVRHRNDWGAVLLVDARFGQNYYLEHLSKWVRHFLGDNHHTFNSLLNSDNSLETFMKNMTLRENEDDVNLLDWSSQGFQ